MKKIHLQFFVFLFVLGTLTSAQTPQDSWNLLFGVSYPRLINHGYNYAGNANFGGFLGFERNFSEHVGLRMQFGFASLEGKYGTPIISSRINSFSGNFDLLYFFVPCETVTPYLTFGAGPTFYLLDSKRPNLALSSSYFAFQVNGGLGIDWKLDEDWKLRTELNYHTVMDNKFDGIDGPSLGGLFGGPYKSYLTFDLGFNYYLDKGEPSKYCNLYSGISGEQKVAIDYDRIEDMIKRHIPKEVTKEVVVEKPVSASGEKWVLVGCNFGFNSAKLSGEAYPILYDAAKTLLRNPEMNVEIQGYTDNVGSKEYNKKLSQKRADAVKAYLVSKGVSAGRLTAVGMGEANPVADNKTADGRAMNRRIEFKVK